MMSEKTTGSTRLVIALTLGVLSISFGSIFVRLSQEAPSLTISLYRMAVATLLLIPWFLRTRKHSTSWRIQELLPAGFFLALHFAFWITSLRFTSVAVSVLLVNTSPLLVALLSYLLFRERLTRTGLGGILLALGGSLLLVWNDLVTIGDWRGPALALLGAAMLGGYLVVGRALRQKLSLIEYVYPTYATATLVLFSLALISGAPLAGFSGWTYCFLALLGLIPQATGHTAYNWALRRLSATSVSILIVAEPFLASLLAWWILSEPVGPMVVAGAFPVLAGIFLVVRFGVRKPALRQVTPVQAAIVVPTCGKEVWVRRRSNTDHLEGYWEFPGGKLRAGEAPKAAALREFREETGMGLEAGDLRLLNRSSHSYPDREVSLYFYRVEFRERSGLEGGEWLSLDRLRRRRVPEANLPILELLNREFGTESG